MREEDPMPTRTELKPVSWWDDELNMNGACVGVAASVAVGANVGDCDAYSHPAAIVFRVAVDGVRSIAALGRRLGQVLGGPGKAAAERAVAHVEAGKWGRGVDQAPSSLRYTATLTPDRLVRRGRPARGPAQALRLEARVNDRV